MNKTAIGENAGIVWRALHNNTFSWEELLRNTSLNPIELACAIGWLARETRLSFPTATALSTSTFTTKHTIESLFYKLDFVTIIYLFAGYISNRKSTCHFSFKTLPLALLCLSGSVTRHYP